jgi:hypothetical protein
MAIAALPKAACFSCYPGTNALGQHAVLPLPGCSYVVTRSRPYPLKVLAVSGWRLGTQAECFASIHSVLDSVLNTVIDSVLCERFRRLVRAYFPSGFSAILAARSFWYSFSAILSSSSRLSSLVRFLPAVICSGVICFSRAASFLRAYSTVPWFQ